MNSLIRWECKLGDEIEIWGGLDRVGAKLYLDISRLKE